MWREKVAKSRVAVVGRKVKPLSKGKSSILLIIRNYSLVERLPPSAPTPNSPSWKRAGIGKLLVIRLKRRCLSSRRKSASRAKRWNEKHQKTSSSPSIINQKIIPPPGRG